MPRRDDGFTLIELMVVVLIIAILLAIAIPTMLGARERASDRAAQSNARNAHTSELVFYTDSQTFTTSAVALTQIDSSLQYKSVLAGLSKGPEVYIGVVSTNRPDDTSLVAARSATGKCYWIRTIGDQPQPRFAVDDCSGSSLVFGETWSS